VARLRRFVVTPFGLAVVGLLVLAGWAVWTAGIFDSGLARQVRVSSVYVAPGVGLDEGAAAKVVGNRRLVVVFLGSDADLSEACHDVADAAYGTLVILFQRGDGELEHYGCSQFPGSDIDGENFGKAFTAETAIASGADEFVDRPLEAVKVVAVNYDGLVRAGIVPDGARTIEPSAPRYLLAGAAVLAVVGGAVTVFLVGRRVGGLAVAHRDEHESISDARASLNAKAAVLAQQIIELDRRVPDGEHRRLAAEYAELAGDLAVEESDRELTDSALAARIDVLTVRARKLARTVSGRRS
jgi:hypothetical protein